MHYERFDRFALLLILSLPVICGCKAFRAFDTKLPEGVAEKYGPTAQQRIRQIEQLGRQARKATALEQQQIANDLAGRIRVEKDPTVRQHIVGSISGCRTPVATAVLQAALNDESLDVRLASCEAWGNWGGPEAAGVLGQVLADQTQELDVRLAAARALGKVKSPETLQALSAAVQEKEDPALQLRAARSLEKITGQDFGNNLVAWREFVSSQGTAGIVQNQALPAAPPSFAERAFSWRR
jgi:hypothetical protein